MLQHVGLELALSTLDAQLRLHIATKAPDRIFVHAGVVACDGRAIVIPGQSFSGKTTLVKALIEAGATYYSDEYAVLDEDGRVHPYARRLSIRAGGTAPGAGSREDRHASDLGASVADAPADVAVVVCTRYDPGGAWKPRSISPGRGVAVLLTNTVPAQERPQQSLRAVTRAVRSAIVLEGERGEAVPTAALLLDTIARLPDRPPDDLQHDA